MHDKEFINANQVLMGVLRHLKESGQDTTKHKAAIAPGDMRKMYESGILSNSTPETLQNKVFVELCLHFGRRGREGLRKLAKNSIVFKTDDEGKEYATLCYHELEKNHPVQLAKQEEKKQIMYAQEDDVNCPLKSLKKYIKNLTPNVKACSRSQRITLPKTMMYGFKIDH